MGVGLTLEPEGRAKGLHMFREAHSLARQAWPKSEARSLRLRAAVESNINN